MRYAVMPLSHWVDILDSVKAKTGKGDALVSGDVPSEIDGIGGVELPTLTNEGAAPDLMKGKQMINSRGEAVIGEFTLENEMSAQDSLIAKIKNALQGKAAGGATNVPTQEKTVDITENGTVEIIPDEGHVLSKAIVNVNVESSGGGVTEFPDGYRRADYIQFNGKQFIDTGIIGNQNTQINVSFTWENSTQRHLFGCTSSDNTASITSYMNGSWRFGNKSASKNFSLKEPRLPYTALVNNTRISTITSNSTISGVNDFETVGTLLLGGARDSDGSLPSVGIVGKVFYFNLWQGEDIVRKLVPVVSVEGVYRFFDLISKEFFDSITDTPLDGGIF